MTDREREARIRERRVLDREEFERSIGQVAFSDREGHPSDGAAGLKAHRRLLAHDAAQRAEIERYREALGEVIDVSMDTFREDPPRLDEIYKIAHRALNEGEAPDG